MGQGPVAAYVSGTWVGAAEVAHEWLLNGVGTGEGGGTFNTTGHAGETLAVRDTATNAAGSATAASASVVIPSVP